MASYRGDKRTKQQKRSELVKKREKMMDFATELLYDVLDSGFRSVWIEIMQIGDDSHFWAKVVIDQEDIDYDRMTLLHQIADAHGAKVMLSEIRMNQTSFSRIALWPESST